MELKTKHRIIGIVVLIALAVIIVPLFFTHSGSGLKGPSLSAHVPNPPGKPDIEQIAIPIQPATASKPSSVAPTPDLATQPLKASQDANNDAPMDTKTASEELATNINSATNSNDANSMPTSVPTQNQQKSDTLNKAGAVKHKFAEAWAIQLGSFSEKKNAESLVKQLRTKGYAAYVQEGKSGEANVSRVYIGPELRREKADAMVKELRETLNLKGVVVKYTV